MGLLSSRQAHNTVPPLIVPAVLGEDHPDPRREEAERLGAGQPEAEAGRLQGQLLPRAPWPEPEGDRHPVVPGPRRQQAPLYAGGQEGERAVKGRFSVASSHLEVYITLFFETTVVGWIKDT